MSTLRSQITKLAQAHLEAQTKTAALPGQSRDYWRKKYNDMLSQGSEVLHIVAPEGTDVEAFLLPYARAGKSFYQGTAFVGKRDVPEFQYMFRDIQEFQKHLSEVVASRKEYVLRKQELLRKRKEYKHDYVVGDILVASWGYDQTQNDYFQVVATKDKQIVLREIASKTVRHEQGADYEVAVPNMFLGKPPIARLPNQWGGVKIDDVRSAHKWDGKPSYATASGYGH